MLTTLMVVLVVLWALGMATSYTLGGFIHGLLFAAVVVLLLKVFWERRPAAG
jgi:multisubunit Na+/H+ antiporter MnhE subunit